MDVGGKGHDPAALSPRKDLVPIVKETAWTLAGLDGCGKFRLPSAFDPWTAQPRVRRYTDWAIRAHIFSWEVKNKIIIFLVNTTEKFLTVFECSSFRHTIHASAVGTASWLWMKVVSLQWRFFFSATLTKLALRSTQNSQGLSGVFFSKRQSGRSMKLIVYYHICWGIGIIAVSLSRS
jgi:hypothetical protein